MKIITNQNGFTYILALTVVMIMGIMLGLVGQSWKTIMQREREKELMFRGSQIKEAIENWYNPKYTVLGIKRHAQLPLKDLKDLLKDPGTLSSLRFLPHSYAAVLDNKNTKCAPDCANLKVYQDPITGKDWNIIKCDISYTTNAFCMKFPGTNTIIGVASKSDETPFRTDFKNTPLEFNNISSSKMGKMTKYSEWKFIADPQNDHSKIYRAYHEGW